MDKHKGYSDDIIPNNDKNSVIIVTKTVQDRQKTEVGLNKEEHNRDLV